MSWRGSCPWSGKRRAALASVSSTSEAGKQQPAAVGQLAAGAGQDFDARGRRVGEADFGEQPQRRAMNLQDVGVVERPVAPALHARPHGAHVVRQRRRAHRPPRLAPAAPSLRRLAHSKPSANPGAHCPAAGRVLASARSAQSLWGVAEKFRDALEASGRSGRGTRARRESSRQCRRKRRGHPRDRPGSVARLAEPGRGETPGLQSRRNRDRRSRLQGGVVAGVADAGSWRDARLGIVGGTAGIGDPGYRAAL